MSLHHAWRILLLLYQEVTTRPRLVSCFHAPAFEAHTFDQEDESPHLTKWLAHGCSSGAPPAWRHLRYSARAACRLDRIETSLLKRNISIVLCSSSWVSDPVRRSQANRIFDETLGNLDKISEHSTEKKFIASLLPPQDGLFLASVRSFCSVLAASAWGTHLVGLVRQFRFNAT